MKQVLKKILPRPVIQAAIDTRDSLRLSAAPRQTFADAALRPGTDVALDRIFADPGLAAAWETDHRAIAAVFGDDNMGGGVNPGDRRALYTLVAGLKPRSVLEVGTHIGASTLHIARALRNASAQGAVVTVDVCDVNDPVRGPWKEVGLDAAPRDMASRLDCLDRITFVVQPAQAYMAGAAQKGETFDLIFLDGDHTPRAVYDEMAAALRILRPGGLILLHDYYPNARPLFPDGNIIAGPFRALARIGRENPAIATKPLGNLPWPTKQGTSATSLALVTRAA